MLRRPFAGPVPTRGRAAPTKLEFARFSLWAGTVGFGGGLSVLAMLRSVTVDKKGWLTHREFDNTATVAQMLPGGAAANALALLGLRFYGPRGAVVAYVAFILPGFLSTLALARSTDASAACRRPAPSATGSARPWWASSR